MNNPKAILLLALILVAAVLVYQNLGLFRAADGALPTESLENEPLQEQESPPPARAVEIPPEVRLILESARQVATDIEYEYGKHSLLQEIAVLLSEIREVKGALDTAIAISDSGNKVRAFWRIALVQTKAGDRAGAVSTLQLAFEAADRFAEFLDIAAAQKEAGDDDNAARTFERAFEVAEATLRTRYSSYNEARIAAGYVRAGDRPTALKILQEALAKLAEGENPKGPRDEQRAWLAIYQAYAEDLDGALETAGVIKINGHKARVMRVIAREQAKLGNPAARETFRQAVQVAADVGKMTFIAVEQMTSIAGEQANAGYQVDAAKTLEQALAIANMDEDFSVKVRALARIAVVQAELGEIGPALQIAMSIKNNLSRDGALAGIARAQAKAGNVEEAVQTIANQDYPSGDSAFREIAVAQAESGDVETALQTADAIERESTRAVTLRDVAVAAARVSGTKTAPEWVLELTSPYEKGWALLGIAKGMLPQTDAEKPEAGTPN